MRCIPACLTPTSEGINQCLIETNSSKVCLVINLFSIFLSLLVFVAGITALVFFSVELGVIHSFILVMCVLAAVFFLVMSSYHLANRKHTIGLSDLHDQRLEQDRGQALAKVRGLDLENTRVVDEIQGELRSKQQQIEEMEVERQRMFTRHQEDAIRIRGFEEQGRLSEISNENERRAFESRIRDLEQAVSDAESQSKNRTSNLESALGELQEERIQLQSRITELETAIGISADQLYSTSTESQRQLAMKDEEIQKLQDLKLRVYEELQLVKTSLDVEEKNNGRIAKKFEKLRVQLEGERDELRIKCLNLEAKLVQLEISVSKEPNSSENIAQYQSRIEELSEVHRNAEEKINELQGKLQFKIEEISTIEKEIQQERQRHEEESSQLRQRLFEATSRIHGLERDLADAASERDSRIQAFRDKRSEYEKEIVALEKRCSNFENTICDLQREHILSSDEDGDRIGTYRALRAELKDEVAKLQKENKEKDEKVSQLQKQVILLSDDKTRVQRVAREQIALQVGRKKAVASELEDSKVEIRRLEEEVQRLEGGNGGTIADLQEEIQDLNQRILKGNTTIAKLENRNKQLEKTVQVYTNEKTMNLRSDPQRSSSLAYLEQERKKIRTLMSRDAKERVSMARRRIERLENLSKGSSLERDVCVLSEYSERRICYQRIFELESALFDLSRSTNSSATGRNRIESMRALRLQQYCDGDAELEARVREFNFPPNAPINSTALYELEQEIFDSREAKLFSLRESLEKSTERIFVLEGKIKELTELLRVYEETMSPDSIEKRSLTEQQEAQQVIQGLHHQLEDSRVQLEDYKTRLVETQNELLKMSAKMQSKDLALQIAEDKLKQFEDK
ncbi:IncA family protein [Chlamydia crocodili]|uniref:IncA family protein n=1 Tax=Chlamydia crocodili TaxID=2766982 RepID=A0ABX8CJH7_9CHLA|nr:IncA family protein [Chlamydia crocodili]QVE49332.1 IncA family protein [Chlamydia crocodili]